MEGTLELRITFVLPARAGTILEQEVKELLTVALPAVVLDSLLFAKQDVRQLEEHMRCVQEQESLRAQLSSKSLIAFIAHGSLLPRVGADCALRRRNSVPFKSSDLLRVVC